MPDLNLMFHFWSKCPENIITCLKEPVICTTSDIILKPHNCDQIRRLDKIKKLSDDLQLDTSEIGLMLQDVYDNMGKQLINFEDKLNHLTCMQTSALAQMSRIVGNLFPSNILRSHTLHKTQTAAAVIGDVIAELQCYNVHGHVRPSLHIENKNKFSSRPIVEYWTRNGETRLGQLTSDQYLTPGITQIEHYVPNQMHIFRVNDKFLLFHNYTLQNANFKVRHIHPIYTQKFEPLKVQKDFAEDIDILHSNAPKRVSQDIVTLLSAVSSATYVTNHFTSTEDETDDTTVSYQSLKTATEASSTLKNSILWLFLDINNPVANFMLSVVLFLDFISGPIVTLTLIVWLKRNCFRPKTRPIRRLRRSTFPTPKFYRRKRPKRTITKISAPDSDSDVPDLVPTPVNTPNSMPKRRTNRSSLSSAFPPNAPPNYNVVTAYLDDVLLTRSRHPEEPMVHTL